MRITIFFTNVKYTKGITMVGLDILTFINAMNRDVMGSLYFCEKWYSNHIFIAIVLFLTKLEHGAMLNLI